MNQEVEVKFAEKFIPVLTETERMEILSYHKVAQKYDKEIAETALEDLKDHPIFGKLISSIPKDVADAQRKMSKQLQNEAIVNGAWLPYIEYQMAQGVAYAKMGFEFRTWYELVALAKNYLTPYLYKEYGKGESLISAVNGMNRFIDIGMALIAEAYLLEKQEIIEKDKHELEKKIQEISSYKYALDESSIVAITDQKGIISYVNENFCKISKYSSVELIGQDHRIINSGYHSKAFIKNIWETIANGKVWQGDLKNKAKDGTIYWVATTIVPFLDANGKPYQYVAIRSDITDKKNAENEIKNLYEELEEKVKKRMCELQKSLDEISNFKSLFEATPGLYLVLLPDLTIAAVTDEYLKATMVKRKDILGKKLFDVFPDNPADESADGVSNLRSSLEKVITTKKPHSMSLQKYDIRRPDGTFEERFWSPLNKPVLNSKGEVIYITHSVVDVTERLKHEREIIRISDENKDLYDNAPCGYFAVDATLKIVNINHTLLSWLGYTREEVFAKMKFEDFLSMKSKENLYENFEVKFEEFKTKGFIADREYDFQRKRWKHFPYSYKRYRPV